MWYKVNAGVVHLLPTTSATVARIEDVTRLLNLASNLGPIVKHKGVVLQPDDSIPHNTSVKDPLIMISEVGKFCHVIYTPALYFFL